jgi:hypothetical protein
VTKRLPPGTPAPASGQHGLIGPRGGNTGQERTATRGEPLPPTPKPGMGYVMTDPTREKFATQVRSETLATLRSLAKSEGRQLQALVDEALSDFIDKRKRARPRAHVMAAYEATHEKYAELYAKLAE